MRQAADAGMTYFDTAPGYGAGLSEEIFGEALEGRAGVTIASGGFDTMQIAYNLLLQHPYEPTRPFGSLFAAKEKGMFTIAMRTITSRIFQRWIKRANPADTFDYTPALIQFVLSNKLIDVALVGMRSHTDVTSGMAAWRDTPSRIDIDALWGRYTNVP